jgi:hypothetical protein
MRPHCNTFINPANVFTLMAVLAVSAAGMRWDQSLRYSI